MSIAARAGDHSFSLLSFVSLFFPVLLAFLHRVTEETMLINTLRRMGPSALRLNARRSAVSLKNALADAGVYSPLDVASVDLQRCAAQGLQSGGAWDGMEDRGRGGIERRGRERERDEEEVRNVRCSRC